MGRYIKKEIVKMMEVIDSRKKDLPKKWDKFIYEQTKSNNILVKMGKQCYCTHCNLKFDSKKKIKEKDRCPYCKQELVIRSSNLKKKIFYDSVMYLDKVNQKLILRLFELQSHYIPEEKRFENITIEFGRIVIGEDTHLLNERIKFFMWNYTIINKSKPGKWRKYIGYSGLNSRLKLYPYNVKHILNGTIYEYSQFWKFIKKVSGCDIENLLTGSAKYPSFELLVKMKLYNLALDAITYNVKGDFKTRFGVSKDFYEFMKINNITTEELEILKLTQIPDIEMINYFKNNSRSHERKELSKYVSLEKVYEYKNSFKEGEFDIGIYLDYLGFADKLGMNMKDKKILFPKKLRKLHDKFSDRIEIINNKETNEKIMKRSEKLLKNKFEDKKYVVFPAKDVTDLRDESRQQNHCVQNYAERYANATCDIYFMRLINNIKKSLVTIEVRDNKIVQKRIKGNDPPTEEQNLFLEKWQQTVLQNCRV